MNSTYLPAIAALAGSAIGGLTLPGSAWLTQHRQDHATRISKDKASRQKLYRQFRRSNVAIGRKMKSSAVKAAIIANAHLVEYAAPSGAVTHPGALSKCLC